MKLRNKLLLATIPAASVATVMPITMASCSKNTNAKDLLNIDIDDFDKNGQLVDPAKTTDFDFTVDVSGTEGGAKAVKAMTDSYYEMWEKNPDFVKQDILHDLLASIDAMKNDYEMTMSGSFNVEITNLVLVKNQVTDTDRKQLILVSFDVPYSAVLTLDTPAVVIPGIGTIPACTMDINLSGTLEIKNWYLDIIAATQTSTEWKDWQFKLWSATHKTTTSSALKSTLKSVTSGTSTVKYKSSTESKTYNRNSSEPSTYTDGDDRELEFVFEDPVACLMYTMEQEPSYSAVNQTLKLTY